jgi:alpha-L-fucosidase 2
MGVSMEIETAPVQLDASMGIINAVQEMLLYVSPALIKLLPALPSRWKKGNIKDFRFMTGRISGSWDMEAQTLRGEIVADRDTEITLKLPPFAKTCLLKGKGVITAQSSLGEAYYDIVMDKGMTLLIEPKS